MTYNNSSLCNQWKVLSTEVLDLDLIEQTCEGEKVHKEVAMIVIYASNLDVDVQGCRGQAFAAWLQYLQLSYCCYCLVSLEPFHSKFLN